MWRYRNPVEIGYGIGARAAPARPRRFAAMKGGNIMEG